MRMVDGVTELETEAVAWSKPDWLRWLNVGLGGLQRAQDLHKAHVGFPPLHLQNDADIVRQIAEIAKSSALIGRGVREALLDRLGTTGPLVDTALDRDYWRLLAALEPPPTIVGEARIYLGRLQAHGDDLSDTLANGVIEALVGAVAAVPPSPGQMAFFRHLSRDPTWWRPVFAPLAVDCAVALATLYPSGGISRMWEDLRSDYERDLDDLADPQTASGRALLRSLARRFARRMSPVGDNETSARDLKKALGFGKITSAPSGSGFHRLDSQQHLQGLLL